MLSINTDMAFNVLKIKPKVIKKNQQNKKLTTWNRTKTKAELSLLYGFLIGHLLDFLKTLFSEEDISRNVDETHTLRWYFKS